MIPFDPDDARPSARLLELSEAAYFAASFSDTPFSVQGGFKPFIRDPRFDNVLIDEGEVEFSAVRDEILRNADRNLLLAVSGYRRGLDLLTQGSAMWAYVTLYYSSFHASNALLGLFGVVVDPSERFIGIARGRPGAQRIASFVWKDHQPRGNPHQKFWENYYQLLGPFQDLLEEDERRAIRPFNEKVYWQTSRRNDLNYDSRLAAELQASFASQFRRSEFPQSLPGDLYVQHLLSRATVNLALRFHHQLRVNTGPFELGGDRLSLYDWLRKVVGQASSPFSPSDPLFREPATPGQAPQLA